MKRILLVFVAAIVVSNLAYSQKYFTREGKVSFYSEAPMEKIEAHNKKATSVLDMETGKLEFAILIKAFQFKKALMQEHFNENYMESNKFPKAKFKGRIENLDEVDFSKDGVYPFVAKGELTIHGETTEVEAGGNIEVKDGLISAQSRLEVSVADYNIDIPSVVRDNIAKKVLIDINVNYQEFKKKS